MRTTNYVCLLVACIATTSTVEATAVNQLEQIPNDLAQADAAAWLTKPACLRDMKAQEVECAELQTRLGELTYVIEEETDPKKKAAMTAAAARVDALH